jgi:hypothetical protein
VMPVTTKQRKLSCLNFSKDPVETSRQGLIKNQGHPRTSDNRIQFCRHGSTRSMGLLNISPKAACKKKKLNGNRSLRLKKSALPAFHLRRAINRRRRRPRLFLNLISKYYTVLYCLSYSTYCTICPEPLRDSVAFSARCKSDHKRLTYRHFCIIRPNLD